MEKYPYFLSNTSLSTNYCLLLFLVLLSYSFSGCTKKDSSLKSVSEENTVPKPYSNPKITYLSELPDSLQPTISLLSKMPKPRLIPVPKQKGNSYERINIAGERQIVELEPPQFYSLPVLIDENGLTPLSEQGIPYLIGNGGKGQFKNYTSEDGLAADMILSVLIDSRGDLWIGTFGGGVSRFDGLEFKNFTVDHGLPNEAIVRIFEDSKGNLWFASNTGGVSKYDGKKFTKYRTFEGMSSNIIWSMGEDLEGNIWFGTYDAGVVKFDGNSFTAIGSEDGLAGDFILGIDKDLEGMMWFGGVGGLNKISGEKIETFTIDNGLPSNAVLTVKQQKNGPLWLGTVLGLSKFDGKGFENYYVENGLADNLIWGIAEESNGKLWLATSFGISSFDGHEFKSHTTATGLLDNGTRDIAIAENGTIWIGTEEAGLSRFEGNAFTNFTKNEGLKETAIINNIFQDKEGNIWFGSVLGLHKYDQYSFTTFSRTQGGLIENTVNCSYQDTNGEFWFGSSNGISRFDGKRFLHYNSQHGFPGTKVLDITQDDREIFWFALDNGLASFNGEEFTLYQSGNGVPTEIKEIFIDSFGNFWIASWYGLTLFENGMFAHYGPEQGMPDLVGDISQDENGNLWLATSDGVTFLDAGQIMQLKNNPSKKLDFKHLTKEEGLVEKQAFQVLPLPDGKIAVGSAKGIQLFDIPSMGESGFSKIAGSDWYHISTGYPVKEINPAGKKTMFLDRDGIIWAATESSNTGLVRFDYKAVNKRKKKPQLKLKDIKLNETPVSWHSIISNPLEIEEKDSANTVAVHVEEMQKFGAKLDAQKRDSLATHLDGVRLDDISPFYFIPQKLVLPYRFNRVTFEYGTNELSHPNLIEYQYFLEGYDRDWSPVNNEPKVTFGNIREGNYSFQIRARYTGVGEEGANDWTEPLTYSFSVLPPWYRTWWAYLIYALGFIGSLRFYVKRREWALKKRQEELEHTVDIRTAELRAEKKKSDDLLLNILPEEVAEELKAKGSADAQLIDEVTVLFTDFKGFTQLSEKLSPRELVAEINDCFSAFDYIMQKHKIEKIKTIGDAYMAAGGLPTPNQTHAKDVVNAALDIQEYMRNHRLTKEAKGDLFFEIRIGIHTGPVVAGIVGVKKFQYDIWGDTVNTASRMESSGETGKVNISGTTYEAVKDDFNCSCRGKIAAKGKGEIDMYFVERNEPNFNN